VTRIRSALRVILDFPFAQIGSGRLPPASVQTSITLPLLLKPSSFFPAKMRSMRAFRSQAAFIKEHACRQFELSIFAVLESLESCFRTNAVLLLGVQFRISQPTERAAAERNETILNSNEVNKCRRLSLIAM
jgi:hypothetical protein